MAPLESGIEKVKNNIVEYTPSKLSTPGGALGGNIQTLQTALQGSGLQADALIFDSFRCRLKELGGMLEDLFEDGFGLGDLFASIKEPDFSALGDALKALNPLNILKNLENLSVEGLMSGIGSIIEGSLGFISDMIEGVFSGIEAAMKGIGNMFDEFGNRLGNLDQLISNTIQGIVSGVTDALDMIGGAIDNVISALTAPCPGDETSPTSRVNADILNNKELFESGIEIVKGNTVIVDDVGHTTGMIQKAASKAITKNIDIGSIIPIKVPTVTDPTGDVTVPGAHGPDGKSSAIKENKRRAKLKKKITNDVKTAATTSLATPPKKIDTNLQTTGLFAQKATCTHERDKFISLSREIYNYTSKFVPTSHHANITAYIWSVFKVKGTAEFRRLIIGGGGKHERVGSDTISNIQQVLFLLDTTEAVWEAYLHCLDEHNLRGTGTPSPFDRESERHERMLRKHLIDDPEPAPIAHRAELSPRKLKGKKKEWIMFPDVLEEIREFKQ